MQKIISFIFFFFFFLAANETAVQVEKAIIALTQQREKEQQQNNIVEIDDLFNDQVLHHSIVNNENTKVNNIINNDIEQEIKHDIINLEELKKLNKKTLIKILKESKHSSGISGKTVPALRELIIAKKLSKRYLQDKPVRKKWIKKLKQKKQ